MRTRALVGLCGAIAVGWLVACDAASSSAVDDQGVAAPVDAAAPGEGLSLPPTDVEPFSDVAPEVGPAVDAGGNTPPVFEAPPSVSLTVGEAQEVALDAMISDAEDGPEGLVLSWVAGQVSIEDLGGLTLAITAPTDWSGVEAVALTVTDSGGLFATQTLQVTVTAGPDPDCGLVTFSYQAAAEVGEVWVSGTFNGWAPPAEGALAMGDPEGDQLWEASLTLEPGSVHQYKFIVDGGWITDPTNAQVVDDGVGGQNSVLVVPGCDGEILADCEVAHFGLVPPAGAAEVLVSGDWNGWGTDADTAEALTDPDGDGFWSVSVPLAPGFYAYKFVVDGSWITDPANPDAIADGLSGLNSVASVSACPEPGALRFLSHTLDGEAGTFTALFDAVAGGDVSAEGVTVSVDWQALEGAVSVAADGQSLSVSISDLSPGIHDVRVVRGDQRFLLKAYVAVSSDWRDSAMYFAMIDRFHNGDVSNDEPVAGVDPRTNYQGGDFAGLTAQIEAGYFAQLGISALWISWPVDNFDGAAEGAYPGVGGCGIDPKSVTDWVPMAFTAYHGYWPSDLDQVESRFGTMEELRALVSAAHAQGIRVLLDFTGNHVHSDSDLYLDHQEEGWFNLPAEICQDIGWETKPTTCWFTDYLPDLDYTHPAARHAMLEHAVTWVQDSGADGFRVDALKHMELSFIEALRDRLATEFERTGVDFYTVGETFTGDASAIATYVGPARMHGQFDFPTNYQLLAGFALGDKGLDAMDAAVREAKAVYGAHGPWMSNFIGNHDIARFLSHAAGDLPCGIWDMVSNQVAGWVNPPGPSSVASAYSRLRLALTYAMTVPGIPLVYHGDEFGMPGAGDPDNRRMMRFGEDLTALESDTLAFAQALGQVRAGHPALRKGLWPPPLYASADTLIWGRLYDDDVAVVVIHRGDAPFEGAVTVAGLTIPEGTVLEDALGAGAPVTVTGLGFTVAVPARSASIYVAP